MLPLARSRVAPPETALGNIAFVLFALVQLLDGLFTYMGVLTFGPSIEANPLIAWYVGGYGAATALIGSKLLALGCGAVLHVATMHRTIAALTALYVIIAIWPWAMVLTN
jgi:hypothetical protein